VAQILADQTKTDSLLQQVRGVTVAHGMNRGFWMDAALSTGQSKSILDS